MTSRTRAAACDAALQWLAFMTAFTILFFPTLPAHAQSVLNAATLSGKTDVITLSRYTIVQKDPTESVTPDTIRASNGAVLNGKVASGDMIYLGFGGQPSWLTIKLNNPGTQATWVVDMGRRSEGRLGHLQSVHAYELTFSGTGAAVLNELAATSDKGIYTVSMPAKSEKLVLFSVKPAAGKPTSIPLRLYTEKAFYEHVQTRAAFNTMFCLMIGIFALFFLSLAIARRDRPTLVHAGYYAFIVLAWGLHENLGANSGPGLFGLLIPTLLLGFSLTSIGMAKVFFNVGYGSFSERYILQGLAWLNVAATALSFFLPVSDGFAHMSLLYGAPLITLIVLCLLSFLQSRSGGHEHYYYLYATLCPLIGITVLILTLLKVFPSDSFLYNSLWYSFIPQGMLMALAVHQKLVTSDNNGISRRDIGNDHTLDLSGLRESKENADNTRLLKVIEREREILAELRTKEAERMEQMRIAKEEADEANRAKSAFLAVVSHEIRTPMTGVMGMVRLLLDSNITKQQRDYAMTIQDSGEAMLALLNDILDFEKIQRGKIELENISFDLHRLIQGVITLMSGHALQKNIQLMARMDDNLPRFVKGDPTRLRQVLLNLMGNAIKFTEGGNVTLLVKNLNQSENGETPHAHDKHMIYFAVQDSGIGISAEAQKNLFNPFSQANSSIARKFGGTGLGLAISKGLIEGMGSTININSQEGEGSTFFFTLRMEKGIATIQEQVRTGPENDLPVSPLSILVVDDNAITRKVVISFLEQGKHSIASSGSAEDALEKINSNVYDLVMMDVELPGMAGNEAVKILRDHPDPAKAALPVIAMTGNIAKEDMERYLADGMSGFLPKPIDPDKLRMIVNEVAHKTFEREFRAPGSVQTAIEEEEIISFPSAPTEQIAAQPEGVFNPDMLQSLKDTIGAGPLNDLLTDLIVKTDEILEQMEIAARENDLKSLAARAHELKGMAGNFGLVEISSIAAKAEHVAKSDETAGLQSIISTLPDASIRAQNALKDWVSH